MTSYIHVSMQKNMFAMQKNKGNIAIAVAIQLLETRKMLYSEADISACM